MAEKQKKILVVEDDITMREIVVHKLTSSGFDVVEADDGKKAVEVWQKEKPDIVLLDLMLPEMDGWEVCRHIRQISQVPIIMLTALSQDDHIILGLVNYGLSLFYDRIKYS